MVEILPSILAADFAHLAEEIRRVERAGVSMLHVDVMDGHFVPNLSIGPPVVESVRRVTKLKLDVHLMIDNPQSYIGAFAEAGADLISIHQEVCPHLEGVLRAIRNQGKLAGAVLNPSTPLAMLDEVLDQVDYVLLMSVNPGFGGQELIPRVLHKMRALDRRRRESGLDFAIEIDGGVTLDNVAEIAHAGCDWIVAGSTIFRGPDAEATARRMRQIAREATAIRV